MKKSIIILLLCTIASILGAADSQAKRYKIKRQKDGYVLLVDKRPTYINGVGGTNRLDMAEANGANAFRTWGECVESIQRDIEKAEQNHMLIMQGIS